MKKRVVPARRLTHGEKSALEDAELRKGGTHWLKIPVEALPPDIRARYDEIMVGVKAAAAQGGTIAVLAEPVAEKGEQ